VIVTHTPESVDNVLFDKHVYDVKLIDKYRSGVISQLTALSGRDKAKKPKAVQQSRLSCSKTSYHIEIKYVK